MRSDPSRDTRQQRKPQEVPSNLLQKVTLVHARSFWGIVLASLLLADKTLAAQITNTEGLEDKNQAQDPSNQDINSPQAAHAGPEEPAIAEPLNSLASSEQLADQGQTLAIQEDSVSPLADAELASLVEKWLRLGGAHAQFSDEVATGSPNRSSANASPSSNSPADARQSFRDLFNDELQQAGLPGLDDASDADVKTAKSTFTDGFNPAYLLGLLGLAGGGGGGAAAVAGPVVSLVSGVVVKGYLQGSLVWRDGDGNGKFNGTWSDDGDGIVQEGEISGAGPDKYKITDAQGKFSGLEGSGAIHVFGGKDIYGTGLAFTGVLSAPDSATAITPLTTLIQGIRQSGESADAAALRLASLLNLGADVSAEDLLRRDPISEALASTSGLAGNEFLTIYAKAAQVANLLVAATAAVQKAAPEMSQIQAANLVVQSIAQTLGAQTGPVELAGTAGQTFIANVFVQLDSQINLDASGTVGGATLAELSQAIASVNDKFSDLTLTASSAKEALTALVQTEYVIQNDLQSAISGSTFSAANYTESAIDVRLAQVASVVGPIAAPAAGQRSAPGRPYIGNDVSDQTSVDPYYLDPTSTLGGLTVPVIVELSTSGAIAGDTVKLNLGNVLLGQKVLTGSDLSAGQISVNVDKSTLATSPQETLLRITAQVETAAGIKGVDSKAFPLILDGGVVPPTLKLDSEDTGLAGDRITSVLPIIQVSDLEIGASLAIRVVRMNGSVEQELALSNTKAPASAYKVSLNTLLGQTATDGTYRLYASQTDRAGHVSSERKLEVQYDATPPTITISANAQALVAGQTALVTFTLSEANSDFSWDGANGDIALTGGTLSALVQSSSNPLVYTATFTPSVSGSSAIIRVVSDKFKDAAGNFNQDGADTNNLLTLAINATTTGGLAPASDNAIGVSDDNKTNDPTPELSGTVPASSTATVTLNGQTYPVTVQPSGAWSFSQPTNLPEGTYTPVLNVTTNGQTVSTNLKPFTLDTEAPKAPTINAVATDNTIIASEQTTTITGTNEAGASVALSIGGNTRAATVTGTSWSYTLVAADITAMGQGAETLSVTQTDAAGNTSAAATRDITVSTVVPGAPTINAVATDDIINASEKSTIIEGTNEAGASVVLTIGANTRAATVSGTSWSYALVAEDITAMGQGPHTLSVTQSNAAGNTSPAATRDIQVLTLVAGAPTINAVATDNTINASEQTTTTITGTNEAGASVALTIGGSTRAATVTGTSWSYTLVAADIAAMGQGPETLSVRQTDVAGNTSEAGSRTVMVDTLVPTAPTINTVATDNIINASEQTTTITGTNEAGASVALTIGGITRAATVTGTSTSWSYTLVAADITNMGQGLHTLSVTQTDAAGNTSLAATHNISVDTLVPGAPTINMVATDDIINASEEATTITGTNEAGASVALTIGTSTIAATVTGTSWSYTLEAVDITNMGQGAETLSVTQTDAAGNTSEAETSTVTVDTEAPTAPAPQNLPNGVVLLPLTLASDTGDKANDGITKSGVINVSDVLSGWEYTINGGTSWTKATPGATSFSLDEGNYASQRVGVRNVDAAGNQSEVFYFPTTLQVDNTPPEISSVLAPASATYTLGQVVSIVVQGNEPMFVTGTPRIRLGLESASLRFATYDAGSGTSALTFRYTVKSGDLDTNGISLVSLQLPTVPVVSSITDAAGKNLNLTFNNVANLSGVTVNGAVAGSAVDGYLVDVLVFVDTNNDNTVNLGEAVGGSVGAGVFSIPGGSGHLIMRGGVDISTGQPFLVQYEAPEGYTVINPVSTLISRYQSRGGALYYYFTDAALDNPDFDASLTGVNTFRTYTENQFQAGVITQFNTSTAVSEAAIAKALGLVTSVNLSSYDAFREASISVASYSSASTAQAAKLDAVIYQKSAAMLAALSDVGGSVLNIIDPTKPITQTSVAMMSAMAQVIFDNPTLSISQVVTQATGAVSVSSILQSAANTLGITTLTVAQADQLARVIGKANELIWGQPTTTIDGQGDDAKDAVAVLRKIVQVQQVVQGDAVLDKLADYINNDNEDPLVTLLSDPTEDIPNQDSLKYLADNAIVGPIVPSRFVVTSNAVQDVAGQTPYLYEGASDGADNSVSFTINRSGGLDGTVVLRYDIKGSSTLTADRFVSSDGKIPTGQVTFGPDENSKTITIRFANNALVNANELLTLVVSDVYGNSQFSDTAGNILSSGTARLMLLDDDPNTPVVIAPESLDAAAGVTTSVAGLVVDYFNPNAVLTVTATATGGLISQNGINFATVQTLTGTLDVINANLALLEMRATSGQTSAKIHLDVTPEGRINVVGSIDVPVTVHNSATLAVTASQNVVAATRSALAPITVSDLDSDVLRVTLDSTNGSLDLAQTQGLFVNKNANGTSWVVEGLKSDLNAALSQLFFTAQAGRRGAGVTVTVSDNDALTPETPSTISLTVATAPPVAAVPNQYMAKVGVATLLTGFTVSDADSSSVTLTLSASTGSLGLPVSLQSGVLLISQTPTTLVLSGSPANLQAALPTLIYTSPLTNATPPTLTMTVSDGVNAAVTRSITVSLVDNAAPGPGGDLSRSALEDTPISLRLSPTTLSNEDGPTPQQIRIISVTGGTITAADNSLISLGSAGRLLNLVSGGVDVNFSPEANRTAPAQITYVVVDPVLSTLNSVASTVTVSISAVNDRPVLFLSPAAVTFVENTAAGAAIAPSLSITDIDSTSLSLATVSFSAGKTSADRLDVDLTGTTGLTKSVDINGNPIIEGDGVKLGLSFDGSGNLTISGTASLDVYRQVLQKVVFRNDDEDLATGQRSFHITVTDNSGAGNTAASLVQTRTIQVQGVNDAPVVRPNDAPVVRPNDPLKVIYDESVGTTTLLPELQLSDPDGANSLMALATVRFSAGYRAGEDSLRVVATLPSGITDRFDVTTGVLTLTGQGNMTVYQGLLSSVAYQNLSAAPSSHEREIQVSVTDAAGATGTQAQKIELKIKPIDDAPVLDLNGTANDGRDSSVQAIATFPSTLAALARLTDVDSTRVKGLTITLKDGEGANSTVLDGDRLVVSDAAASAAKAAGITWQGFNKSGERVFDNSVNPVIDGGPAVTLVLSQTASLLSYESFIKGVQLLSLSTEGERAVEYVIETLDAASTTGLAEPSTAIVSVSLVAAPFASVGLGNNPLDTLKLTGTLGTNNGVLVDLSSALVASGGQRLSVSGNIFGVTKIDASEAITAGLVLTGASTGEFSANTIIGSMGKDIIIGGGVDKGFVKNGQLILASAADILIGEGGSDTFRVTLPQLDQGPDNFKIYGDSASQAGTPDPDSKDMLEIQGTGGGTLKADVWTNGTLTGIEGVRVIGSGNFELNGSGNADELEGGTGADTLIGGLGADMLTGGSGNDRFVFAAADTGLVSAGASALDRITDLSVGDVIVLPTGLKWLGATDATPGVTAERKAWFNIADTTLYFETAEGIRGILLPASAAAKTWSGPDSGDGPLEITVLPGAPRAPDLIAFSDTGADSIDNITRLTTPTFSISLANAGAQADNQIRLYARIAGEGNSYQLVGVKSLSTADLSLGAIQIRIGDTVQGVVLSELRALLNGVTYDLSASQFSSGLESGKSGLLSNVVIDTVAPSIAITAVGGADGTVSSVGGDNVVTGTAEANRLVEVLSGSTVLGSVTANESGNWSYALTGANLAALQQGSGKSITARQTDVAGNTGTSAAFSFAVDTVAPTIAITAAGGVDITVSSVSGDNVVGGTAEASRLVEVLSGSTVLGSVTADALGNWSYALTGANLTALGQGGSKSINARQTDAAGNTGTSAAFTFSVDTVAPTIAITAVGGADSTVSSSSGDNVVSGTAEANRLVEVLSGSTVLGMVTADASGNWTYALTGANLAALQQGTGKSITARQTDVAGNTGTSAAFSFAVDTVAPTIAITAAGGVDSTVSSVSGDNVVGGTAEASRLVEVLSGSTVLGSVTADALGNWSYALTGANLTALQQGTGKSITARQTDVAGNTGTSAAFTFAVDTLAPAIVITAVGGADGTVSTVSADNTVSGTAEANRTVEVLNGGTVLGSVTANASGNWSYTLSAPNLSALQQGSGKTINARQTDAAGNTGTSAAFTFAVDTVAPAVAITAVGGADGTVSSVSADNTVTGTADANRLVEVLNGGTLLGSVTADASGNWTYTLTDANLTAFQQGSGKTINARQTDAAGNTGTSAAFTFAVDTVAPAIAITAVGGADSTISSASGDNVVSGTAEANRTVQVLSGTTVLGSVTADSGGAWSYTFTYDNVVAVGQGSGKSITARQTDAAGNTGNSAAFTFSVNAMNSPPTSTNATTQVTEDTVKTFTAADFGTYADNESDALTSVQITSLPGQGVLSLSGVAVVAPQTIAIANINAGLLVYTPALNDNTDQIFSFKVQDSQGEFSVAAYTLTLDLMAVNDAPVVTNNAGALAGTVTEAGAQDNGTAVAGTASVSGTLTATDVDAGATRTWTITDATPSATYGTIAINATTGVWTYTLNNSLAATQALKENETVTQTYTARVTDDFGAFVDQTITVTINGTNDVPVVSNQAAALAGTVTEAGNADDGTVVAGTSTVSGTLSATDVDAGATRTWTISDATPSTTYGTIAINATTGVWTYTLNNSLAATQALKENETVTQTYTARVTDDFGAYVDQTITVTINGTNDVPVVSN
uniref:Ig-like domain-containing protein n=1 Tax=Limnohabitans sp. TaxID=1907725 RepID=UPI0037C0B1AA